MTLDLWRLIIDFGLVILIWLTQLVIYPGMRFIPKDRLVKWHQSYTPSNDSGRISTYVGPTCLIDMGVIH